MKKCYFILLELKADKSYLDLINRIKEYGTWAKITDTTWSVVTITTATEIRDSLTPFTEKGDRVLVIKSGGKAAWRNTITSNEWLKKYIILS